VRSTPRADVFKSIAFKPQRESPPRKTQWELDEH
jgi:hypothetical protein